MNILLIGNGFDLAHGLPTKYENFLDFIDVLRQIPDYLGVTGYADLIRNKDINFCLINYLSKEYPSCSDARSREMMEMANDNVWIKYFLKVYKVMKKNGWVGFEREIADVVQAIDAIGQCSPGNQRKHIVGGAKAMPEILADEKLFRRDTLSFLQPDTVERLVADLDRLKRCLEIYLCLCLDLIRPDNQLQTISEIMSTHGSIDAVLSFG